jgi:acyl-CoA synthetase (NDP forming)
VAADAAAAQAIALPALEHLKSWARERVPGEGSLNPLDMTGFVMRDPNLLRELFDAYAGAKEVDALVLCWWAGEGDESWSRTLLEPFADVARDATIPLVVTPVESTAIGSWTREFRARGVAFCRGLTSTYRALRALDDQARAPSSAPRRARHVASGSAPALIDSDAGAIVAFDAAMQLLARAGMAVAPYAVLEAGRDDDPAITSLGEPLVVKLADVPHRTELGAIRTGVARRELPAVLRELREVARAHRVPETIAVQSQVAGDGEAFIGLQARTDFGPLVLFGRGGVLVELAPRVGGRLVPLGSGDAESLVAEVAPIPGGVRGREAWPVDALGTAVEAVASLWEAEGGWLGSVDLNPVIVTAAGVVAVDALLVARGDTARA